MHYANGREAKVGDLVVGKTYNRKGLVAGTLVTLTPGVDQCSAKVGFLDGFVEDDAKQIPVIAGQPQLMVVQRTQQHGMSGPMGFSVYREDYTHAGNLLHVEDAAQLALLGERKE